MLTITRDLSAARRAAQQQVVEARRRWLDQLVQQGLVAVVEATPEGVLDASDSFLKLLGYTRLELRSMVTPRC